MDRIPGRVTERMKATVSVQRLAEGRGTVLMWTSISMRSQKNVAMAKHSDGSSPSGHRVLKKGAIAGKYNLSRVAYTISASNTR